MQKPELADPTDDKRCRAVHVTWQGNEDREVATQEIDVVRSKGFKFHSIRSVIIAKLKKAKKNQKNKYVLI